MVVLRALTGPVIALTFLALPLAATAQEASMQDLGDALAAPPPPVVIYSAKEIVTLDPARPSVTAVAVAGDQIVATGSLDQVRAALGRRPFRLDATFANQVIVPGLIAQHDHPLLAGLTMTSEIIAIEDWVLPQGTARAARNQTEYLQRLRQANDRMQDPAALLLTWGYHQYFHGQLRKADLDAISSTRPIIVWHRSAHEVHLNSAAERKYGITREWFDSLPASPRQQSDFANAHYWEQGVFAVSRPEQVARIRRLGAIVSGNPYYPVALADNYPVHGLGPHRADAMVRMGDVERAGVSYSYHSDMPMAPAQPLFLRWSGVNRITNDGNVRGAEQRVSPLGALRAITLDAAYSLQLEHQVGSIVSGKLANFTILAANPLNAALWGAEGASYGRRLIACPPAPPAACTARSARRSPG